VVASGWTEAEALGEEEEGAALDDSEEAVA
jgi:hypothetical protein